MTKKELAERKQQLEKAAFYVGLALIGLGTVEYGIKRLISYYSEQLDK